MTYRFGPFVADRTSYQVLRDERVLDLTPKQLDLLFYLLERPAVLVTKEALLDGVWPGTNVTDNALAQTVSDLREALGDRATEPTYIRTIARRGYRFVAPVTGGTVLPATTHPQADGTRDERETPTIGVLDFINVTGDQDIGWLASGIAETVTSDLAKLNAFRVVDRRRLLLAARAGSGTARDIGAALGLSCAVVGSYQRQGPSLRITARILDLAHGTAIADAKVDGPVTEAFALHDGIVDSFARKLGLPLAGSGPRTGVRETASLDAYRAYTEGWLKIESLDTDRVPAAIQDFERAIAADPGYAIAHTGLANAQFVAYEMTRVARQPNGRALEDGLSHARHAVRLDGALAEAHATLSFLLVSAGHFDDARASAQTAVAIEADNWRHQYRLGHASWGEARLRACEHALALYPQFAYALFEMAMVFVARNDLDAAQKLARAGAAEQDRQAESGHRFPAVGFHWLRGALEAAAGHTEEACAEFDRELAQVDRRRLYGPEYAALALVGRGHAMLAADQPQAAVDAFRHAQDHAPAYPRAVLGERLARGDVDRTSRAPGARDLGRGSTDRAANSAYSIACEAALLGRAAEAIDALEAGLDSQIPSFLGWTTPIEPAFAAIRDDARFQRLLARLADRAR